MNNEHDAHMPADPIAAASHLDPYPFYARLRAGPPLQWHAGLKLWVASRAEVIEAALSSPALRVRPVTQPVPAALASGPAGALFGHLVRMNDGPVHREGKAVLRQALAALDLDVARDAARELALRDASNVLDDALFALPVQAVARALGFAPASLDAVVPWVRRFVASLSPRATPPEIDAAHDAAQTLMNELQRLLAHGAPGHAPLLDAVREQAATGGWQGQALLANLAGLLSQTCEATAGLLGNSLLALARHPHWRSRLCFEHGDASVPQARDFVAEVARHDSPVQSTRRFVTDDFAWMGEQLLRDQCVLLVLASGNRDAALNARPDAFEPDRAGRRMLGFGFGPHQCSGQALAIEIVVGCIRGLQARGLDLRAMAMQAVRYRPVAHARIPVLMS